MKLIRITFVVLFVAATAFAQKAPKAKLSAEQKSITWNVDDLQKVGGQIVTVIGEPRVIKAPGGKAVLFDGLNDGLLVNANPVAGAHAFTVEAVFRPDEGGAAEQRWFHIQSEQGDDRVLLETRLVGKEWFLDTFIKSGTSSRPLFAENFKHPLGQWYHVALVYDGTSMRHYVDGKEELSGALTIEPLSTGKTSIGVRMNHVFWFKGAIRKARFTRRALAPKEFMGKK